MVNSIHKESSTQIILKILWYMYIIIQKSNYMHTSYIFCKPKIRLDKVAPTINVRRLFVRQKKQIQKAASDQGPHCVCLLTEYSLKLA